MNALIDWINQKVGLRNFQVYSCSDMGMHYYRVDVNERVPGHLGAYFFAVGKGADIETAAINAIQNFNQQMKKE